MASPDYAAATSVAIAEIPVVDISDIGSEDGFKAISQQLVHSAQTVGFFYISGHGIDPAIMQNAFVAQRKFFDLSVEEKATVAVDQHQRGWMAQGMAKLEGAATHDAKEVFFWGWDVNATDADVAAGVPMVHPNQWPDDVAPFLRQDLLPYYHAVLDISRSVLSALAVGLGQSRDFFNEAYQKPLGRGQLVYYPPLDETDVFAERFGAAAHTDFGVLTVLMQDMQGGLQVRNAAGAWIEAPPIENTFVCNIGDLLERWTNGRLVSTKHRVINRKASARYSIPIFCDPASQTIIDPKDFGAEQSDFEIRTAGDHIMGRNKKNFAQYK